MPLIRLSGVSLAFGSHALLDKIDFQIQPGERVALIGRNGVGKSSLIRLIAGVIGADEGEVWRDPDAGISLLEQAPRYERDLSIYEAVAQGLGEIGGWIADYHALSLRSFQGESDLKELGCLQDRLEASGGWTLRQRVERILRQLKLPADQSVSELSGGWIRRVALAQALVREPQLLLLDEPSNHLDLETIQWLEERLLEFPGAVLMVTHDRSFLKRLATRIVDLDRGRLSSWPGTYSDFLRCKAAALREEERRNAQFDKKLAKEEAWIRQGIKARRTRNEGRVRVLEKLRIQRAARRDRIGNARIAAGGHELSGKRVIEVEDLNFSYASKTIVSDFSLTLLRGDRVGLIGPNGAGKSTLLKLLLRQIEPGSGSVRLGTGLKIAYFDQMREELNPEQTLVDWVGGGSDFVEIRGSRKHVLSYLGDFLFSPARSRSPISSLSGGEQNRLLLARLFRTPANLVVMDEPTNDLDVETLELLEDLLINFEGSLLLISHDREFLDNIVTSTLVFEGEGEIREFVGGYSDWLRQRDPEPLGTTRSSQPKPSSKRKRSAGPKTKLSYKEQRELENLPARIEALEARQHELNSQLASSHFYQSDQEYIRRTLNELEDLVLDLESSYARWAELETLQSEISQGAG
ncbi:MAG: ATP-binding cassette domain-containing protein [Methylococcaceae bacterium]|nr:ATP-binding cassette domain-containing protein [Methylococcaceae bacterium]MCI0733528.1 ATP-binding cassette domain-containing protein [Methylococcaceae bacterium]